jgi:hypothetical protein
LQERELSVGEIEAGVFTDVMKYIYSGQVEFNPDTVVELMAAANQLRSFCVFSVLTNDRCPLGNLTLVCAFLITTDISWCS